ncbi:hypothetical protein D8I24_4692 [Cupriavidus necator H850]|nr:hypothetical protein D8I24_4692 [Cupriavidus necator H850]
MKTLPVLDDRATGIDVGSEKLHVSIAGDTPRVFGTMTQDVSTLIDWLRDQGVRSVDGRQVRNLPGRKTDMADCQWLATLHAHGLLHSGFVPPAEIRQLQDYLRLRQDHITLAASHVQHMQKALERMNVKFHAVISDLTVKVIDAPGHRPGHRHRRGQREVARVHRG